LVGFSPASKLSRWAGLPDFFVGGGNATDYTGDQRTVNDWRRSIGLLIGTDRHPSGVRLGSPDKGQSTGIAAKPRDVFAAYKVGFHKANMLTFWIMVTANFTDPDDAELGIFLWSPKQKLLARVHRRQ